MRRTARRQTALPESMLSISRGLPTTLFYDAKGSLVYAHFGVLNPAALETRLQALRSTR